MTAITYPKGRKRHGSMPGAWIYTTPNDLPTCEECGSRIGSAIATKEAAMASPAWDCPSWHHDGLRLLYKHPDDRQPVASVADAG